MTYSEERKLRILEKASKADQLEVTTRSLANEHGIPEPHIRQELMQMAHVELIGLSAWDGERDRRHDEWPDVDAFFSNKTGRGRVRIELLENGAELVRQAGSA